VRAEKGRGKRREEGEEREEGNSSHRMHS